MRNQWSKWFVPRSVWPSDSWGFGYANGCAFWQTLEALRAVQTTALCVHVLFIDDVNLSGRLREWLGIRIFHADDMLPYGATPEKMERSHSTCSLSPADLFAGWALTAARLTATTTHHPIGSTSPATAASVHLQTF